MNREFDPCKGDVTLGQNLVRMTRVLNIAKEKVLEPDALWGMGFAASAVVGIGIFEGALMTRRGASGRIKFCVRYGISNLLPSIIWATTSPKLLAQRMKLDVKLLLRDIDKANLVELAPNKAKQAMRIESFYVLRSIIAGFVGISQILRIMGIFSDAQIQYKELVLAGRNRYRQVCERELSDLLVAHRTALHWLLRTTVITLFPSTRTPPWYRTQ
jgi:hypothetical protein